jgi:adenosylcobinamide-GDP ribazoletransferase
VCVLAIQPVYGAAAVAAALLTFFWYYRMAMKQFGGINGDLAGCFLSVCELVVPFVLVVVSVIYTVI